MKGMRTARRTFIATALCAAAAWPMPARAAEALVIEDWRESPTSATGVPPGWKPYETPGGHPAYDFSIVDDDGRRALRMKSDGEHSTIAKESTIRLAATPVLRWDWKAVKFPAGADLRERKTSDATAHIFVLWPRFPAMLRSRLIGRQN